MMNHTPKNFLSSFFLKVIAIITMTIDHLAAFLYYFGIFTDESVLVPLRIVGRIAFPMYAFLALEGALHTKNIKKYLIRLAALAIVILIPSMILELGYGESAINGNIFFTLIAGIMLVYFFRKPNRKIWYFTLPAIYLIVYDILFSYMGIAIPQFLEPMYGIYGLATILGFYLGRIVATKYVRRSLKRYNIDNPAFTETREFQNFANIIECVFLLFIQLVCYIIVAIDPQLDVLNQAVQSYALLAAIPLLFYSGKIGYNPKWFKITYYLYYPTHIAIIALVMYLIAH